MTNTMDGPSSPKFQPLTFPGNTSQPGLAKSGLSTQMTAALEHMPMGNCISWGIPFSLDNLLIIKDQPVSVEIKPTQAKWLIFQHTSDIQPPLHNTSGFITPMRGEGQLGEKAAEYEILFEDGTSAKAGIYRRFQIGAFQRIWGENGFECVTFQKPQPIPAAHEQRQDQYWGVSQMRTTAADHHEWTNWLWAWENPTPDKIIIGFRFSPGIGTIILSAISTGDAASHPLRWQPRQKACLILPTGDQFLPNFDENGLLKQIRLDLGQVISATPRLIYPNDSWANSYNNQIASVSNHEVLIEYTAHAEANFHLSDGRMIPINQVVRGMAQEAIQPVQPAQHSIKLRVVEHGSSKAVPVKLHVHGEWGEYLAPVDRHRILNIAWFEDYSVDFAHLNWAPPYQFHSTSYIPGETLIKLPEGKIFIEVSKGFEIRPVRKVIEVTPTTQEIQIEVIKILPWREQGWVTADTHVHFLSPMSAMLEGSAEGVNVINLLASQWGELMTNVGDFDGRTTWGSRETGGDGEYLVRVGTENRQHVLGHISLLGYQGSIIVPMTTGGPDESAMGDPIEVLLTEWARQCHKQNGLVVLPHFPNPRAEHAASIVSGEIDAVEMTSWGNLYGGIDPYSLADWYRYLNCGYLVPAVGGTDKMAATTAVGTVRTYARIKPEDPFTYENWKKAVLGKETFVTYGPLLEFNVDGHSMGSSLNLTASGGTLDVTWKAASVTVPMSRVELVVNGEIQCSQKVDSEAASGHWAIHVEKSCWLALLIRGHYDDKPEIIAAHSSPVMVQVEGSPMLSTTDAVTILEQIEGALAYLDTIGTRAEDKSYKRMRLVIEAGHRSLHNRMHQLGQYHAHTPVSDHSEHHQE